MFSRLLFCVMACATALVAQTIDNVEFALPDSHSNWILVDQIENSCGAAVIFSPEEPSDDYFYYNYDWDDEDEDESPLFYATYHNVEYQSQINPAQLEDQLALMFPFVQYQFYLIEQDGDSALLEFYGFDQDGPLFYGMLRKMRSAHGTVTLTYMMDMESTTPKERKAGLLALQSAIAS